MVAYLRNALALCALFLFVTGCTSEEESSLQLRQVTQALGGAGALCTGPADCDDSNPCTQDLCNAGTCDNSVAVADGTSCDDGLVCTATAECQSAVCTRTAQIVCNDDEQCTTDTCDDSVAGGCVYTAIPADTACDDGDPCTTGETCNSGGRCGQGVRAGTPVTCPSDNNPCTSDACVTGAGCTYPSAPLDGAACDDNEPCTTGEKCDGGSCGSGPGAGTAVVCPSDNNACTSDACVAGAGCSYPSAPLDGQSCDDNEPCTTGETCNGGACGSSTPVVCTDDGNVCTNNTCVSGTGCVALPLSGTPCSDGIACTENDTCAAGVCAPGSPNDQLCPQPACAIGICQQLTGCTLNAAFKKDFVCNAAAGSCDVAEICDGVSPNCPSDTLDAKVAAGTQCSAASCVNGVQTDAVTCDGTNATCATANVVDCGGYSCDSGSPPICKLTCASSTDCLASHYCDTATNTCQPRLSGGSVCTSNDSCSQGDVCVDGVCCNDSCVGRCEACDVPGSVGTCTPVPAGEAPHAGGSVGIQRDPCNTDGSSCGGSCDGTDSLRCSYPSGDVCKNASCSSDLSQATAASTCNGNGTCITPVATTCSPYLCNNALCANNCVSDAQCEGDLQCANGVCIDKYSAGQTCTNNTECASGYCVDNVCCNSSCNGQCQACDVAGKVGQCSPVSGAPHGKRNACAGSGDCGGSCDGSNVSACRYPSTGVSCRDASCSDGTATLSAFCNGTGSCAPQRTVSCPTGVCDGELCGGATCAINSDCDSGQVCAAGICVDPGQNGDACSEDSDCSSDFCVDGVCCESSCDGQCEACDVAGSLGSCSPVAAGDLPHGSRQACTSDGSACGGSCDGTARDACVYPEGTTCRDPSCSGGVAQVEGLCNGEGSCPAPTVQDCGGLACTADGLICDGACATDPDSCGRGEYCLAGVCVELKLQGQACGADRECVNGKCVDGFCCNSDCGDQCAACNVAGAEGTCTPVEGATQGPRAACAGSGDCAAACDGATTDSCSYPGADTSCGLASCVDGVVREAGQCNGSGRCDTHTGTRCNTTMCDGDQCAAECATDEECLGDLICLEGSCKPDPFIDAVDKGSCGCKMAGQGRQAPQGSWLLLLPLALLTLRRRKRHAA